MDDEALRQFRERHWSGLRRIAERDSADRVGLMSGGPNSVRLQLEELAALGVEGWTEPVHREPGGPPTFSVYVWLEDLPKLVHTDSIMTPERFAASDLDGAEHAERCRAERPWVELWWEDCADDQFEDAVKARMTLEQAQTLREWVVAERPTWRGIAEFAHIEFSQAWRLGWYAPGHQGVGIVVSGVASSMFGEACFDPPWN